MISPVARLVDVYHYYYRYRVDTSSLRGRVASLLRRERVKVTALQGVTLDVWRESRLALLGPNGAGKSTLLKILLGVIKPVGGRVEVFGLDPYRYRRSVSRRYGVVFGGRDLLWWHIPVIDSLRLLQRAYNIDEYTFEDNLERYGGMLCPGDLLYTPPQRMSLGQRKRCEFLAALIHGPNLLVLDEPFLGLDIFVREGIMRMLEKYTSSGGTVVLTTHEISEVPEDYSVALMHRGRIIYRGDVMSMLHMVKPTRYIRLIARSPGAVGPEARSGALNFRVERSNGLYVYDIEAHRGELNRILGAIDFTEVLDIRVSTPPLNRIIMELIRREEAGGHE